jgi:hypothetical protein
VDGETLQERIQRGPIPLDDAIDQSVPDSLDVHLILDNYGKNRRNKQRYREVRGAMSRTKRYVGNVEKTETDSEWIRRRTIDRIRRVFQDLDVGVAVGILCGRGIRGLKRRKSI